MKKRFLAIVAILTCVSICLTGCYSAFGEFDTTYLDDKMDSLTEDEGKGLLVQIGVEMQDAIDTADKYVSDYPYGLPMTGENDAMDPENIISFTILNTNDANEIVYSYQTLQYKPFTKTDVSEGNTTVSSNETLQDETDAYSLTIKSNRGRAVTNSMRTVIACYNMQTHTAQELWSDTVTVAKENLVDVTGESMTLSQYMSSINYFVYPYNSENSLGECDLYSYAFLYKTTAYLLQKENNKYRIVYQRDINDMLNRAFDEKKEPESGYLSTYDITSFAMIGNTNYEVEFQIGMSITNRDITENDDEEDDDGSVEGVGDYLVNISSMKLGTVMALAEDEAVDDRIQYFKDKMNNGSDFYDAATGANNNVAIDLEDIYLENDDDYYIRKLNGSTIQDSALRTCNTADFYNEMSILVDGSGYKSNNQECFFTADSVSIVGSNIRYAKHTVNKIEYTYSTYDKYCYIFTNFITTSYTIDEVGNQNSFFPFSDRVMFAVDGDDLKVYRLKDEDDRSYKGGNYEEEDSLDFDEDIRFAEARHQNGHIEIMVQDKDKIYLCSCTKEENDYELDRLFEVSLSCLYYPGNLETVKRDDNRSEAIDKSQEMYDSVMEANKDADYTKYNSVSLNDIKSKNEETYDNASGDEDSDDREDMMKVRNPDSYSIFGIRNIDGKYYICSLSSGLVYLELEDNYEGVACHQVSRYPCFMFSQVGSTMYVYGFDNYKNIYNIRDKARSRVIPLSSFYTGNNVLAWYDITAED